MSQRKLDDLYDRLTSRKLWLCLLSVAFALWNYSEGRLTPVEFQAAIFGAIGLYTISEAATDAAASWHATPDTTVRTTVNTGDEAPPAVAVPTTRPARMVRRSQVKRPPAVLTEPVVGVPPLRRPRARPPLTDEPEGLT